MKLEMFAIYDSAAGCYRSPMFFQSAGLAIRAFGDAVKDDNPKNELHVHAGDFYLRRIGEFEDTTGAIAPLEAPQTLITGDQCLAEQQSVTDADYHQAGGTA